jgi:hypothetical protein
MGNPAAGRKVPNQICSVAGTNPLSCSFADIAAEHSVTRGQRYRQYAAECVRLARQPENSGSRDLLLQMAEHWRQLAERTEEKNED